MVIQVSSKNSSDMDEIIFFGWGVDENVIHIVDGLNPMTQYLKWAELVLKAVFNLSSSWLRMRLYILHRLSLGSTLV